MSRKECQFSAEELRQREDAFTNLTQLINNQQSLEVLDPDTNEPIFSNISGLFRAREDLKCDLEACNVDIDALELLASITKVPTQNQPQTARQIFESDMSVCEDSFYQRAHQIETIVNMSRDYENAVGQNGKITCMRGFAEEGYANDVTFHPGTDKILFEAAERRFEELEDQGYSSYANMVRKDL